MDGPHADRPSPFDVGQDIVDEHGIGGLETAGSAGQLVDRRVGLGMSNKAGHDIVLEQTEEGVMLASRPAQPGVKKVRRVG